MPDNITLNVTEQGKHKLASTGSKWEPVMGYSRAVRAGNFIAVTGTVGIHADGSYSKSIGEQAKRSLQIITAAIESLGGTLNDVVRTRMFVTDVSQWEEVAQVHGSIFADIRPATTIVEVARLIDQEAMIEIEADAILST